MRLLVVAWLLAPGCARDLRELSPFPCAADQTCPSGFACMGDVCMPNTCEGVRIETACTACGAERTVACGSMFCPANSLCVDGHCACAAGYEARDCRGLPCVGACVPSDLWCAPTEALTATCDQPVVSATTICTCGDGRMLSTECGEVISCAERCSRCDLIDQGTCPKGDKCTLVGSAIQDRTAGCVPHRGAGSLHESCTGDAGNDDCAVGLYCTSQASSSPTCAQLCYDDATCPTGERCHSSGNLGDVEGFCVRSCDLFGSECGAGRKCEAGYAAAPMLGGERPLVTYCERLGTQSAGSPCTTLTQCGPGLTCGASGSGYACVPFCDNAHPCPSGACVPHGGLANGAGWCRP